MVQLYLQLNVGQNCIVLSRENQQYQENNSIKSHKCHQLKSHACHIQRSLSYIDQLEQEHTCFRRKMPHHHIQYQSQRPPAERLPCCPFDVIYRVCYLPIRRQWKYFDHHPQLTVQSLI